jgi:YD repeat-containing protein
MGMNKLSFKLLTACLLTSGSLTAIGHGEDWRMGDVPEYIPSNNAERMDTYLPGNWLLFSTYLYFNGEIELRSFNYYHFYDGVGVVEQKTVDDSHSWSELEKEGINERHIWYNWRNEAGLITYWHEQCYHQQKKKHVLMQARAFVYDENQQIVAEKVKDMSRTFRYTVCTGYDDQGRVRFRQDPIGDMNHFAYQDGTVRVRAERTKFEALRELDENGRVTSETIGSPDTGSQTFEYEYDDAGNLVTVRFPDGTLSTSVYDQQGMLLGRMFPDGTEETFIYDNAGRVKLKRNRDHSNEEYGYDSLGRLANDKITSRLGEILKNTTCAYAGYRLATKTRFDGDETTYSYDFAGRMRSRVGIDGITSYAYDDFSRPIEEMHRDEDTGIRITHRIFDMRNRVLDKRTVTDAGVEIGHETYSYAPGLELAQEHWVYDEFPLPDFRESTNELLAVDPSLRGDFDMLFETVNSYREESGLIPLAADPFLSHLAQEHANQMAAGLVPVGVDGSDERLTAAANLLAGTELYSESVAVNSGEIAFHEWVGSEPGQARILSDANLTGIGIAKNEEGQTFSVQIYARPAN